MHDYLSSKDVKNDVAVSCDESAQDSTFTFDRQDDDDTTPKPPTDAFASLSEGSPLLDHNYWRDKLPLTNKPTQKVSSSSVSSGAANQPCASSRHAAGTATVSSEIWNLVKNIVGSGSLSLPNGIAAFGATASAIIPASFLMIGVAALFGYYFLLLGRICRLTNSATYREAWEGSVGEAGAGIVSFVTAFKPTISCLAYSMILADTVTDILYTFGLGISREMCLWIVSAFFLLPLCLLKSIHVLAPFSIIGLIGMLVAALTIAIRYFDGSYDVEARGHFLVDIEDDHMPSFSSESTQISHIRASVFVCMLFEAYIVHFNAPRYYTELKDSTVGRFGTVSLVANTISCGFYIVIACFGFLTFGSNSSSNILNAYSTKDALATASRLSVAISIVMTYPLVFIGVRDGFLDLLSVPSSKQTYGYLNTLTVVLLFGITVVATFAQDLGIVNTLSGGTLDVLISIIFPTMMFRAVVLDSGAPGYHTYEVVFCIFFSVISATVGIAGVWFSLNSKSL